MIEKLEREQLIALERETNLSLAPIYRAIGNDDYDALRGELSKASFDINQSATTGVQLPEKITLLDGYTSMAYAIAFGKTSLVELFLLMGANPHGGYHDLNPIHLIDKEKGNPATNAQIKKIFMQYQNPGQSIDIEQHVSKHEVYFNGPFIDAIKHGDHLTVERMLSEGLIYTDQCCHNIFSTALALAVESQSFDTVELLVQRGAAISNYQVRLLLENYSQEPWCQRIAKLLELEKQKQLTIMDLFCLAKGDLEVCREAIDDIKRQYKEKVIALKDSQAISMEWNNYSAMQTRILSQNELSTRANPRTLQSIKRDDGLGHVGSVDISAAFNLGSVTSGNIDQHQGMTAEHHEEINESSETNDPQFIPLLNKIQALKNYGEKPHMIGAKGDNTIILAEKLRTVIINFAENKIDNKMASQEITQLIKQGHKTLGEDRNIADIIAHICLALTGVGLVIMGINKLCYGSFFLNSTKRQIMLDEIKNDESLVNLVAG